MDSNTPPPDTSPANITDINTNNNPYTPDRINVVLQSQRQRQRQHHISDSGKSTMTETTTAVASYQQHQHQRHHINRGHYGCNSSGIISTAAVVMARWSRYPRQIN